jgi:U4/U6.U5 tri-snRNP-associated protein 2
LRCAFRGVDFGDILGADVRAKHGTTYDLLANIVHDGEPTKGTYRVHILHKVNSFYC